MPKLNTHIYIANKAMDHLKADTKRIAFSFMQVYYLGSVFPDIFWMGDTKTAEKLHGKEGEKTNAIVFEMLDKCRTEKDLAFVFGYLTHMAGDAMLHPLVIAKKKELHHIIETHIDRVYNHAFYAHEVLYPHILDEVGVLGLFGLPKKKMRQALRRTLRFNRTLKSRTAYWLAKLLDKWGIEHVDRGLFYCNDEPVPKLDYFRHPATGKVVKKTLDQLMIQSIELSAKMIQAAYDYHNKMLSRKKAEKAIRGVGLNSGMEGVPSSKLKSYE